MPKYLVRVQAIRTITDESEYREVELEHSHHFKPGEFFPYEEEHGIEELDLNDWDRRDEETIYETIVLGLVDESLPKSRKVKILFPATEVELEVKTGLTCRVWDGEFQLTDEEIKKALNLGYHRGHNYATEEIK